MITPRFQAEQDENFVLLSIEAPFVKFSEGEMVIQDTEFSFFCKPYYLKLHFSGEVIEDGTESASYSIDCKKFHIKVPKAIKGEKFQNLDMLTSLLTPSASKEKNTVKAKALIEVIDSSDTIPASNSEVESNDCLGEQEEGEIEIDWSVEQSITGDDEKLLSTNSSLGYGFNSHTCGLFSKRPEERYELLDIGDPDTTSISERKELQIANEISSFNSDHYMADISEDDVIQELIQQNFSDLFLKEKSEVGFTTDETDALLKLPKKEYIMDSSETRIALTGLADILYAYLYDMRTTCYEGNVESAWTIRKLSGTCSWLSQSSSIRDTVVTSVRRSLCFPLYRHWILSMKVLDDLTRTLRSGKRCVLKCLLHINQIFNSTEPYFLLNDLYISDYCVWIQFVDYDKLIRPLIKALKGCSITKDDVIPLIITTEQEYLQSDPETDSDDSSSCSEGHTSSGEDNSDNDLTNEHTHVDVVGTALCGLTLSDHTQNSCNLIQEINEED